MPISEMLKQKLDPNLFRNKLATERENKFFWDCSKSQTDFEKETLYGF